MGDVDYGNIDYASSEGDSLIIDQGDWLKDLETGDLEASKLNTIDSHSAKDDKETYSLSFESVTDLRDQKYTGFTENTAKCIEASIPVIIGLDEQNHDIKSYSESNLNSIALSASDLSSEILKPSVNSILMNAIEKTQSEKELALPTDSTPAHIIDRNILQEEIKIDSYSDMVPVRDTTDNIVLPANVTQIPLDIKKESSNDRIVDNHDALVEVLNDVPLDLDKSNPTIDLVEVADPDPFVEKAIVNDEKSIEAPGPTMIVSRPKDNTPYLKFSDLMELNQEQANLHFKQHQIKPKTTEMAKSTSAGKFPKKIDDKTVKKTVLQKINKKTQDAKKDEKPIVKSPVKSKLVQKHINTKEKVKAKVTNSKFISKDSKSKDISLAKDIDNPGLIQISENVEDNTDIAKDNIFTEKQPDIVVSELQHVFDEEVREKNSTIAQLNAQLEENILINKNLTDALELKTTLLGSKEAEISNLLAQIQFLESLEPKSEIPKNESEQETLIRGVL